MVVLPTSVIETGSTVSGSDETHGLAVADEGRGLGVGDVQSPVANGVDHAGGTVPDDLHLTAVAVVATRHGLVGGLDVVRKRKTWLVARRRRVDEAPSALTAAVGVRQAVVGVRLAVTQISAARKQDGRGHRCTHFSQRSC